ncbi:retrovirus-related pol polyprotein from transposon TNT 1-94 [Tanacetum coccineum]|uniref:Retrovirus-related pol polyprotein from transposon TNT 1-94 n=1 Tax=Tanacetum coccineum TaxID=301880 RepID=A0ABQ5AJU7_9ASTR
MLLKLGQQSLISERERYIVQSNKGRTHSFVAEKTDILENRASRNFDLMINIMTFEHSSLGLILHQMVSAENNTSGPIDEKTDILNGPTEGGGYVAQAKGFVNPRSPKKVYLQRKALYGLKQAPRAWYDKLSNFLMSKGFTKDADHAGCIDTRKSTSGGYSSLVDKLVSWSRKKQKMHCNVFSRSCAQVMLNEVPVSWMSKKQNCTAMSSAEAEYVALSASCAQVMWMRTQLQDYGFNYNKIPLYCDSQSAIAISCNPVQHLRTKHIHTRYHFIKEQVENGIIELYFVRTEYQLADMFTKALPEDRFKYLVRRIGMRCLTPAELEVLTNETA